MIVIIDYGIGNLQSVQRAFEKVGAKAQISQDPETLKTAEKIVLPGVGSFAEGMANLHRYGFVSVLEQRVVKEGVPFLGICLGFQMLTNRSEEGEARGLGWINGETKQFHFDGPGGQYRIPHMGWNEVSGNSNNPLFKDLPDHSCFYFAHSFYVTCQDQNSVMASTQYGHEFVSVVQKGNIFGTQFHPEKSHLNGLTVIKNFMRHSQDA